MPLAGTVRVTKVVFDSTFNHEPRPGAPLLKAAWEEMSSPCLPQRLSGSLNYEWNLDGMEIRAHGAQALAEDDCQMFVGFKVSHMDPRIFIGPYFAPSGAHETTNPLAYDFMPKLTPVLLEQIYAARSFARADEAVIRGFADTDHTIESGLETLFGNAADPNADRILTEAFAATLQEFFAGAKALPGFASLIAPPAFYKHMADLINSAIYPNLIQMSGHVPTYDGAVHPAMACAPQSAYRN